MWSRIAGVLLKIILCFTLFMHIGYTQTTECKTPDGENGECVSLTQCPSIFELLKSLPRPIPVSITRKLQSYTCGHDRYGGKICCPTEFPQPTTPKYEFPNRQEAPDVMNHKNIDLLPEDCGFLDENVRRITNGYDADLNEFPWMALLEYETSQGRQFLCGGTIINYNYILTAAHCAESSPKLVSVRVGEYSLQNTTDCIVENNLQRSLKCNPPTQDLKVEEIIKHPQYKKSNNYINDIALLRVSGIKRLGNIYPVCLPVRKTNWRPTVLVTGWGLTNSQTKERADILQKVSLPVTKKGECAAIYSESNINILPTQVCAGGSNRQGTCSGDSGGPMLVVSVHQGNFYYLQVGIVSGGPEFCGIARYPNIFTKLELYMDWILDNMKP